MSRQGHKPQLEWKCDASDQRKDRRNNNKTNTTAPHHHPPTHRPSSNMTSGTEDHVHACDLPRWVDSAHTYREGRVVTWGGRVDTSGHFFHRFEPQSFLRCCFSLEFGAFFLYVKKSLSGEKSICVFIINGPNCWDFMFFNEHMRIHTRTPKNTTLHHPSTHSDNDTDQKHHKSLHFRTHLDQSRKCLYLLSRISGCAPLNLCW